MVQVSVSDFSSIIFGKYCLSEFLLEEMWDFPRFLLGGLLQVLMKQNIKNLFKHIGYFRDFCRKLVSNNACFAAEILGFMIHILGLRIFPKSFGFLLGCPQEALLEIICGRPLLRKSTEICSRISLKNCLWLCNNILGDIPQDTGFILKILVRGELPNGL